MNQLNAALFIFSIVFASGRTMAQDDLDTNLVLTLRLAKVALLPYEPVMVTICMSNGSGTQNASIPGRWEYLTGIQFTEESAENWKALTRWGRPEINMPPLPPIPLEPDRSLTNRVALYPFDVTGDLRLRAGRRYILRAALQGRKADNCLRSTTTTLQVVEVTESDRAAYDLLTKDKDLMRLLTPALHVNDVAASPKDAEQFIARFPNSVYSDYLRFTYVSYSGQGRFSTNQATLASPYRADLMRNRAWILEFLPKNE